jgi:hypothetical protein
MIVHGEISRAQSQDHDHKKSKHNICCCITNAQKQTHQDHDRRESRKIIFWVSIIIIWEALIPIDVMAWRARSAAQIP